MKTFSHIPVLLKESIEALKVKKGGKFIDATAGGGGHTGKIIEKGGKVLAIDCDLDAIEILKERFGVSAVIVNGNFSDIELIASRNDFLTVNGIFFDLGVSSYQLDSSGRGFSIRHDEKLDMRMDLATETTALDVVNKYPKSLLTEIFYRFGEEHNAEKIAIAIVEERKKRQIETTRQLAEIIEKIGHKSERMHPATRVFQAIRIEVNQELEAIRKALEGAVRILDSEGRIVVISFHSLEDRIVKKLFDIFQKQGLGKIITKKPIVPSESEKNANRRSRSAKMRVFEKI